MGARPRSHNPPYLAVIVRRLQKGDSCRGWPVFVTRSRHTILITTAGGQRNVRSTTLVEGRLSLEKTTVAWIRHIDFSKISFGHGWTGYYGPATEEGEVLEQAVFSTVGKRVRCMSCSHQNALNPTLMNINEHKFFCPYTLRSQSAPPIANSFCHPWFVILQSLFTCCSPHLFVYLICSNRRSNINFVYEFSPWKTMRSENFQHKILSAVNEMPKILRFNYLELKLMLMKIKQIWGAGEVTPIGWATFWMASDDIIVIWCS